MKSFKFHLQKVLDLKDKEKEQAEWALGRSMQRKVQEEEKLHSLYSRDTELTESIINLQVETCSALQLSELARYKQTMQRLIAIQSNKVHGCEQEVEQAKNKLAYHARETQLWEKLKEKSKSQYEEEQNQREQKVLDEIGLTRYFHRLKAN